MYVLLLIITQTRISIFECMIVHLRVIDFVNERVETLAGNGTKGSDYQGGRKGTSQARNLIPVKCFFILIDY